MRKALKIVSALIIFSSIDTAAQETPVKDSTAVQQQLTRQPVLRIKKAIDYPLTIAAAGWGIWGSQIIYGRDTVPGGELMALDRTKINNIDRWVSYHYSKSAARSSDVFFYGSMPFPLILLLDKKVRKEAGKVGVLYLEAMGITSAIYVTAAMTADRFRPYAYNHDVDMSKRTRGGARNSFFAGHVAIVTTSMFFTAQTYINFHPEMKNKWILYTGAGLIAATTGYLRIKAGQHFVTDVATGLTVGTLSGLLVPYFHKIRPGKNGKLTILPNFQGTSSGGFTLLYNLDKKRGSSRL